MECIELKNKTKLKNIGELQKLVDQARRGRGELGGVKSTT